MALTAEQQSQLEFQIAAQQLQDAVEASRRAHEKEMEQARSANAAAAAKLHADAVAASAAKQARLDAIRMAKETLVENARSKPVDARDITASDITAFADTLIAYINK